MRPLLAVLKGEGRSDAEPEGPRFRLTVDVVVDDEEELEEFVDARAGRGGGADRAESEPAAHRDRGARDHRRGARRRVSSSPEVPGS